MHLTSSSFGMEVYVLSSQFLGVPSEYIPNIPKENAILIFKYLYCKSVQFCSLTSGQVRTEGGGGGYAEMGVVHTYEQISSLSCIKNPLFTFSVGRKRPLRGGVKLV